jgi:hypothetical protein
LPLAYFALIVAIVSTSILDLAGARFSAQLGMATAAISLLAVSTSASKADRDHFQRASSGTGWLLIAIPLCIAAQLVPIWLLLAHPIWTSASEALPGFAFGYVTVDFSQTLAAFFSGLAAISLIGVTIIVARDRHRAELILFVLSAVTTFAALLLNLHQVSPVFVDAGRLDLAATFSGFGLVLNLAVMQLAAERAETRRALSRSMRTGLFGFLGALINGIAIFAFSNTTSAIAATFGVVLFLLILIIRRLDLSAFAAATLIATALLGAAIILAVLFDKSSVTTLSRHAPELASETSAAIGQMFADTRWFGSGAGGFATLGRIYQGDPEKLLVPPSTAAAVFVDMGWIGIVVAIAIAASLSFRLIRGALARGRDSFFPSASAACVCLSLAESFAGPGLLQPAAILCLSVIAGLGLAQSVSQPPR